MPKPALQRVEELFHAALALAPAARAAFLDSECAGDADLRSAVEDLLRHDDALTETERFLTSPVASAAERYRPDSPTVPTTASDRPADLPHIPSFELLGDLGHGGMGIVYRARQTSLNRIVALKMLLPIGFASPEQLARFRSETEILARMRHPNIVPIYDVGEFEGRPYFVMEFVDGPSLGKYLAGKPQPPLASARLIETLARTIQIVHDRGVIHRDLKPANVLLEKSESGSDLGSAVPKITDFGLAKDRAAARDLTLTGMLMGTPCYMAPEQARSGETSVGPAADIYSLGAILYEMLTGRPPFSMGTPEETIVQVLNDEPLSPVRLEPGIPRDLVTICLKCLEKAPEKRYATAGELADDLRRFQAGEPIRARPVGMIEHSVRWCRRRPLVAALTALCALLATGFLITVIILNARLREALARAESTTEEQRQQIVQLNIHIGITQADSGDAYAAVLRFVEALRLDEGKAEEPSHRVRIAKALQRSPRLVQHRVANQPVLCAVHRVSHIEVASIRDGQFLEISDAMTGQPIGNSFQLSSTPRHAALSDDGRWMATVANDDAIRVWNRQTGTVVPLPLRSGASVVRVAFHSDNSTLAVHYTNFPPSFWNLGAEPPAEKPMLATGGRLTALSDNGRWLFRIDGDNVGRISDTSDGKEIASNAMRSGASMAAISSDGQHVAVLGPHHNLTIYDVEAAGWHENQTQILASLGDVADEQFSPDGRRLLLCDSAGSVCVCDVVKGQAVTPTIRHHGPLASARIVSDRQLVTVTKAGMIRVWELATDAVDSSNAAPDERPVEQLIALAQVLAGGRINQLQVFEPMNSKELQSCWDRVNFR